MNTEKTKKHLNKNSKIALVVIAVILVLIAIELIRSNSIVEVESFEYKSAALPESFDGVKIVSVTDYHNHGGAYEDRLIKKISEQSPDYIFLAGDIIDSSLTDFDVLESFLNKCTKIAPCYLCYGNHELRKSGEELERYNDIVKKAGVTLLDNEMIPLERGGQTMWLAGVTSFGGLIEFYETAKDIDKSAPLLCIHHHPENFEEMAADFESMGFESSLFFCGHAHGGLIRIPFTRIGAVAPGQGILPKYTGGKYFSGDSEMLLSRGCGNSGLTLRFFDPFEIIVCELKQK